MSGPGHHTTNKQKKNKSVTKKNIWVEKCTTKLTNQKSEEVQKNLKKKQKQKKSEQVHNKIKKGAQKQQQTGGTKKWKKNRWGGRCTNKQGRNGTKCKTNAKF